MGTINMTKACSFPRTISGTNDLVVDNLKVTDTANINNFNTENIVLDQAEISTLDITAPSGSTFKVTSFTQGTAILDNSAVFLGGVGIAKGLNIGENLQILDTTASTSTTTGCATFAGGIGVVGRVSSNSVFIKSAGITSNGNDLLLNGVTANVALRPNFSANGEFVNGTSTLYCNDLTTTQIFTIDKVTLVTSVKKLKVTDTTASTSTTTGAAIFDGGIGVADRVSAVSFGLRNATLTSTGNDIVLNASSNNIYFRPTGGSNAAEIVTTPTIFYVNNTGSTAILSVDKNTEITTLKALTVTNTTASTSTTAGGIISSAGLSISNNTQATSATNGGGCTIAGGLGVGKNIYGGGTLTTAGLITGAGLALTSNGGTWSPIIYTDTTITYTKQVGTWYVIGEIVFININLTTTSAIAIGSLPLQILGLPFNAIVGYTSYFAAFLNNYDLGTSSDYVLGLTNPGFNNVEFINVRDGLTATVVQAPTTAATRSINLSYSYRRAV